MRDPARSSAPSATPDPADGRDHRSRSAVAVGALSTVLATALTTGLAAVLALGLVGPAGRSAGEPAAAAAQLLGAPDVGPERARPRGRAQAGFSPGFAIIDAPPRRLRQDLAGMRRVGARSVRIDVSWARIQPRPGVFDWSDTDRVVAEARRHRLRVLAVIGYEPPWARGYHSDGRARSVDPAAFAAFAGAAARRYRRGVHAWEIWNEPNTRRFWGAQPDPAAYARLVDTTAPAIRANDPGAPVLVGGLAPAVDEPDRSEIAPETFLARFYESVSSRLVFNAVSVHPYSYPAMPDGTQSWNTFHKLHKIYALMQRAGDGGKKIWLTEYGAPTGRSARSVSVRRQGAMLARAHRQASRLSFVGPIYFYSYRDHRSAPRDPEANFGVVRHSGRPKKSFWTLRRALRREG